MESATSGSELPQEVHRPRFTVFTPTYNRAHTLPRLYQSLCEQTLQDFEWVIVDDGSTDNTTQLLHRIASEHRGFRIILIKTANGGKHRAINKGVGKAHGELFFIVDSDDYLPEDALAIIDSVERSIPPTGEPGFAGVCGLKAFPDGRAIGTSFPGYQLDITTLERGTHGISGDKAEVFYTAILHEFPYPEFEGEKYITPRLVYDRIAAAGKKLRFFNDIVYFAEYLSDGITMNRSELLSQNPRGQGLYLRELAQHVRVPFRLTVGRYLLYYDEHHDTLSCAEIAMNLGLTPNQLRRYLALRSLGRHARSHLARLPWRSAARWRRS